MIQRIGRYMLAGILACCMIAPLAGCSKETYIPKGKAPTTAAVGTEGTLRVGVAQKTPFAGQVSGKFVGLDIDIAAALADQMGLKLEIVDAGSNLEGALEGGTVDIVMGLDKNDPAITAWRSDPYIKSGVALFAKDAGAPVPAKGDEGLKIAAQNSSMSAWEVSSQFGDSTLTGVDDLNGAFEQLFAGSVSYVAADAAIGTYTAHTAGDKASVVALMQNMGGYSIGVAAGNTDLTAAISDALAVVSSGGIISLIEGKWLGAPLSLDDTPKTAGAEPSGEAAAPSQEEADAPAPENSAGENAVQPAN